MVTPGDVIAENEAPPLQAPALQISVGDKAKAGESLAPTALAAVLEDQTPGDLAGIGGQHEVNRDRPDSGPHDLHRRQRAKPFVLVKFGERGFGCRLVGCFDPHRGKQKSLGFWSGGDDPAAGVFELGFDPHPLGQAVERAVVVLLTHSVLLALVPILDRPAHRKRSERGPGCARSPPSPVSPSPQITRPALERKTCAGGSAERFAASTSAPPPDSAQRTNDRSVAEHLIVPPVLMAARRGAISRRRRRESGDNGRAARHGARDRGRPRRAWPRERLPLRSDRGSSRAPPGPGTPGSGRTPPAAPCARRRRVPGRNRRRTETAWPRPIPRP